MFTHAKISLSLLNLTLVSISLSLSLFRCLACSAATTSLVRIGVQEHVGSN